MYGVLLIFDLCVCQFSSQILHVWLCRFKFCVSGRASEKKVRGRDIGHTLQTFPSGVGGHFFYSILI